MIFIFAKSLLLTFSIVATGNLIWTKFFSYNLNGTIINKYLESAILGGVFLGLISFILNFILPLKIIFNNALFIFPILFLFLNYKKKEIFILFKLIVVISFISTLLLSYSNFYRPDAGWYHIPFVRLITDYKLIVGTSSLHWAFGNHSILQYLSAFLSNSITGATGMLYTNSILPSVFLLFFLYNFYNEKKLILKIFLFLIISIFFIEMNRYSEYGNDYPAHFIFYYILSEIIFSFKSKNKDFSNLFLASAFILMNKLSMIFSIILPFLILNKIEKKKILNYKNLFSLIFLLIWIIKNSLISGCLLYPISKTCLLDLPWTNIHKTNKVSIETEAWSKSWNNEKNPKFLNQEIYIKNFNWINTWSENHLNKINKILIPYLIFLILITIYIDTKSKKTKKKIKYKKELKLILILIILIAVWFIKIPLFRFGFSYLVCLISLFFAIVCSKYENYKNKKIFLSLFAFCIIVFIGKNLLRFENYFTEYNQNIWPKIKIQNKNKLKKVDIGELKYYESLAECGYGFAPCTHYKNLKLTSKNFKSYKVIIDNEKTN